MNTNFEFPEVHQICAGHGIEIKDLKSITGSFGKKIFIINQEFLLRVSKKSMSLEQEKFRRIANLNFVPKIVQTGSLQPEAGTLHYTLLTLLPGEDLINAYLETTQTQQIQLGQDIAEFLKNLREISGTSYDIGMYVPVIPNFPGTWREGHLGYWEHLKKESEKLPLRPDSFHVFESAFQFLQATASALDYQAGPVLLHNDFHPQNIILHRGKFSGVIDWECSQFGEADFELCHLIHWCLYPPRPDIDFRTFLGAFFRASPECVRIPHLAERLTIYQIEHEIQQIIWNASTSESWRVPRLVHWMDGGVESLFREFSSQPPPHHL